MHGADGKENAKRCPYSIENIKLFLNFTFSLNSKYPSEWNTFVWYGVWNDCMDNSRVKQF